MYLTPTLPHAMKMYEGQSKSLVVLENYKTYSDQKLWPQYLCHLCHLSLPWKLFLCKVLNTMKPNNYPVAIIPLEFARVNADWYIHCLPQALEAWSLRRPKTGIRDLLLHHDNALAHTAVKALDFLAENCVQLVSHPPYSPDLAPCDFFLFPNVKEKIRGIRFDSPEEARLAFQEALWTLPEDRWYNCFDSWFHRMKLCIECSGKYFEKLWNFDQNMFCSFRVRLNFWTDPRTSS